MVPEPDDSRARIRVRLLPSMVGGAGHLQYANTFVIDDRLAVDAGSLGFNGTPEEQARVREVLLTHSHADHIASLPILLINDFQPGREPIRVWATETTERALREHVFNDVIWPDLDRIGTPEAPFVRWGRLEPERPIEVAGLRVTPVAVDHTIETVGFLVEGPDASVVIGGDSGPTSRLWELAARLPNLRAVFLETSFPDEEAELAVLARHLTPRSFAEEVAKLPPDVRVFAVHFKPTHDALIREQLAALGIERLELVVPGQEWAF